MYRIWTAIWLWKVQDLNCLLITESAALEMDSMVYYLPVGFGKHTLWVWRPHSLSYRSMIVTESTGYKLVISKSLSVLCMATFSMQRSWSQQVARGFLASGHRGLILAKSEVAECKSWSTLQQLRGIKPTLCPAAGVGSRLNSRRSQAYIRPHSGHGSRIGVSRSRPDYAGWLDYALFLGVCRLSWCLSLGDGVLELPVRPTRHRTVLFLRQRRGHSTCERGT